MVLQPTLAKDLSKLLSGVSFLIFPLSPFLELQIDLVIMVDDCVTGMTEVNCQPVLVRVLSVAGTKYDVVNLKIIDALAQITDFFTL